MTTKDKLLNYLQLLLMSAGGFFIGKYIGADQIDQATWNIYLGSIISAAALVWAFVDRVAGIEQVQTLIKGVLSTASGVVVSAGWFDDQTAIAISGVVGTLLIIIYEYTGNRKSGEIAKGTIAIADLTGVDEKKPELIQPTIENPKTVEKSKDPGQP